MILKAYKSVYVDADHQQEFDRILLDFLYDQEQLHPHWGIDVDGDWDIEEQLEGSDKSDPTDNPTG